MTNKKLGLLLLPLIPLSAIGIVDVASRIMPSQPVVAERCQASVVERPAIRDSAPPALVAPPLMPAASPRG